MVQLPAIFERLPIWRQLLRILSRKAGLQPKILSFKLFCPKLFCNLSQGSLTTATQEAWCNSRRFLSAYPYGANFSAWCPARRDYHQRFQVSKLFCPKSFCDLSQAGLTGLFIRVLFIIFGNSKDEFTPFTRGTVCLEHPPV